MPSSPSLPQSMVNVVKGPAPSESRPEVVWPSIQPVIPWPVISLSEARAAEDADILQYAEGRLVETEIKPQWNVGDAWEVDTYYLQIQQPLVQWSHSPIRWRFEVLERLHRDGTEVFRVRASALELEGILYVRASDYQLVGLRERVRQQGEWATIERRIGNGRGIAEGSVIPFEMVSSGTKGKILSSVSGRCVPQPLFDEPETDVPATMGFVIDVERKLPDGSCLRQRWDLSNTKWPTYSRTPNRASFLRVH